MRTQRGKVHEAGEGDSPEACGVDNVGAVDLGAEQALDIRASRRGTKQRTNQKTIRQPIVQAEHNVGDKTERCCANAVLVIKWPGGANESPVVDEGFGSNVEIHCGVHGHKRKHGYCVGYEPPLNTLPSAMDGVEERRHTLEEQQDEHP